MGGGEGREEGEYRAERENRQDRREGAVIQGNREIRHHSHMVYSQ